MLYSKGGIHMASGKHETGTGQDLRNAGDRRTEDGEPPMGWRERRRKVERRMPTVKEDEISQNEWFKRMATFLAQRRAKKEAISRAFELLENSDSSP